MSEKILGRGPSDPGSCLTAEPQSVSGHSPCDPPRGQADLVRRSDVLAICQAAADVGVDYIFSEREPDHDRRREAMEATATSIKHAVANLKAAQP